MGRAGFALLFAGVVACQGSAIPLPTLSGVAPDTVIEGTPARLQVTGENLYVRIVTDLINPKGVRANVSRYSGTVGGVDLLDVTWVNNSSVEVTLPADLPVDVHDLSITTADGYTAILTDALTVEAAPVGSGSIDSVGEVALAADVPSSTFSIVPPVDPNRSVLFFTTSNDSVDPQNGHVSGQISNDGASVRFERLSVSPPLAITIRWTIITHPSFSVQRGTEPFTSPTLPVTFTNVDTGHAFVLASMTQGGGSYGGGDWLRSELIGPMDAEFSILASQFPTPGSIVDWQVVEVAGATVQSDILTLPVGQVTRTVNPPSPMPVGRSLLIFSYLLTSGSIYAIGSNAVRGRIASDTEIVFNRGTASDDAVIVWYLLSWDRMLTQHGQTPFALGEGSHTVNLADCPANHSSAVALLPAIQRQGSTDYVAGDAVGLVWFTTELRDNDCTLVLERGATYAAAEADWTVVWFE